MEKRSQTVASLEVLQAEAAAFVTSLMPQEGGATLVTLSGDLGAGKTAFVQAAARALGVTDTVTSPTFVIEKVYALPATEPFDRLVHIDAYRLEDAEELTGIGFPGLLAEPSNLIMLEWPERVAGIEERAAARISIEAQPDGSRVITYA